MPDDRRMAHRDHELGPVDLLVFQPMDRRQPIPSVPTVQRAEIGVAAQHRDVFANAIPPPRSTRSIGGIGSAVNTS